jgi:hypothetical protein
MTDLNRRQLLSALGAAPAALAFTWTPAEARAAAAAVQNAAAAGQPYTPRFFTPREFAMIVALADLIIPRDARSGSASDAGVPEFIDYITAEQPGRQVPMRGGLAWLDARCQVTFEKPFLECTDAERHTVIDEIAWPSKAAPGLSQGVRFFNTMRDLTAAGFFSSRIGVEDLGYMGNQGAAWDGAPANVLQKLGVSDQE